MSHESVSSLPGGTGGGGGGCGGGSAGRLGDISDRLWAWNFRGALVHLGDVCRAVRLADGPPCTPA